MWDCHRKNTQSEAQILSQLTGTWSWQETDCSAFSGGGAKAFSRASLVIFGENQNVQHIIDGREVYSGTWTLSKEAEDLLYTLSTQPISRSIEGLILFCEDRLEINGSFRGYCDHYFTRAE